MHCHVHELLRGEEEVQVRAPGGELLLLCLHKSRRHGHCRRRSHSLSRLLVAAGQCAPKVLQTRRVAHHPLEGRQGGRQIHDVADPPAQRRQQENTNISHLLCTNTSNDSHVLCSFADLLMFCSMVSDDDFLSDPWFPPVLDPALPGAPLAPVGDELLPEKSMLLVWCP